MKLAEMRALVANANTNCLALKHQALKHMAQLCESTHDQPNLRGDGGEWLIVMPFPARLSARVASMGYANNHDQVGAGKARRVIGVCSNGRTLTQGSHVITATDKGCKRISKHYRSNLQRTIRQVDRLHIGHTSS